MELIQAIGLLIFGFVILIKGADFLVDGASSLAKRFNISDMVIGLTIVSFGTSAPELVVNLDAAWRGENAMILGNIIGSNIYNTCLILGAAGIIYPLSVQKATMQKEFPFSVLIIVLLFILGNDAMIYGGQNSLSHIDGWIMFGLFLAFLGYVYNSSKTSKVGSVEMDLGERTIDNDTIDEHLLGGTAALETGEEIKEMPLLQCIGLIVVGMVGLVWGGRLVLDNSVFMAEEFGMTKRVIGLTVVAIGTSLPELATSVVAALKKNSDIAIGNVVGSNIFNILLVLGFSAGVSPNLIEYDVASNFDLYFLMFSTILLFCFLFVGTKGRTEGGTTVYLIDKWQAGVLLVIVSAYTIYLLGGFNALAMLFGF